MKLLLVTDPGLSVSLPPCVTVVCNTVKDCTLFELRDSGSVGVVQHTNLWLVNLP
jgi:hypothetical protein